MCNQSFWWRFYVVTLLFGLFCWCRGFCHRTESDVFLFLFDNKSSAVLISPHWLVSIIDTWFLITMGIRELHLYLKILFRWVQGPCWHTISVANALWNPLASGIHVVQARYKGTKIGVRLGLIYPRVTSSVEV